MAGRRAFLLLGALLAAAGFLLPLLDAAPDLSLAVYLIATSLVSLELLDIAVRLWLSRIAPDIEAGSTLQSGALHGTHARPYAIVIAIRDLERNIDELVRALAPYKARTWIIDDCSTDQTAAYLSAAGWRCLPADRNRKKPGAIQHLLERMPAEIETVVTFDPDCVLYDSGRFGVADLEHVVHQFQRSDGSACCPRIRIREDGLLASFQLLECELAFAFGRKGMSPHTITSGVSIYDRAALARALAQHSLSVYAEDLENTLILLAAGERIYFDEALIVETEGKRKFAGWFSQRVGWSFGLVRVLAARWPDVLRIASASPWAFYNFAVYLGGLSVLLFPFKLAGVLLLAASFVNAVDALLGFKSISDNVLTDPKYFAVTYTCYTTLILAAVLYLRPRARFATLLVAVPFYAFYSALHTIPVAIGYLNWISVRLAGRRVFRDHYGHDTELHSVLRPKELS